MTKEQILQEYIARMEKADFAGVRELLDPEFIHYDTPMPPLDRESFLKMAAALKEAFPRWETNLVIIGEVDETTIKATVSPTATHEGWFRFPGITPVPPTGLTIALPRSVLFLRFKGDKIIETHAEHPSDGGMVGLFQYLGITLGEEEL